MKFKKGVTIKGIKPEIVAILPVIESVYREFKIPGVIITCVTDGKHKGHQHSLGYAVDIRTRDITGAQFPIVVKNQIRECLKRALTNEFDVVVEKTHIHVEFDIR